MKASVNFGEIQSLRSGFDSFAIFFSDKEYILANVNNIPKPYEVSS